MISIEFSGAISQDQRQGFIRAAQRWDNVIETAFSPVFVDGEELNGLRIDASIESIDGEGGILGQAGPTVLMNGTELPVKGIMQFDESDVRRLESEGSFNDVIVHEMGHVIGLGTLWSRLNLVQASGTINPQFVGSSAMREFAALLNIEEKRPVPIANTGGSGTREGHWREMVFGDELMTGFLSGAERPLSRLSVASFEDMGYSVNYDAADDFRLPTSIELAEKGVMEAVRSCQLCRMGRTDPIVLES